MTRVLHIVLNLQAGGLERLVVDLATRADRGRFESHVLALQFAGRHADALAGIAEVHVLPRQSRWSMAYPQTLINELRRLAPDVVHTHSGVWYKGAIAARLAGVPRVIHTDHGRPLPDRWRDRATDALAARATDVVVAVSAPLAAYMRRRLGVPAARLRIIRNGVDTSAYSPACDGNACAAIGRNRSALRRELGISSDTPIIGSVGRLDAVKGYDALIDAFAALGARREGQSPALVIAGDGPELDALRVRVASLPANRARAIHLLGWRRDVDRVLSAFDVFAMASLSEGTSVSLLEAMSAGVCPVVSAVGGTPDVLGATLAHRLVPRGAGAAFVSTLSRALDDTLENPERREADGLRARARVASVFDLATMIGAYEGLYTDRVAS